jgi:hypothetical protein
MSGHYIPLQNPLEYLERQELKKISASPLSHVRPFSQSLFIFLLAFVPKVRYFLFT